MPLPQPPKKALPGFDDWVTKLYQWVNPRQEFVTVTSATYSVNTDELYIICNRAGTVTITLPTASRYVKTKFHFITYTANTVVSASSNVVPQVGGAAGTAILAATAGKWATLVSDGTNWVITASN